MNNKPAKVVFLKDDFGVYAFFPNEKWDNNTRTSYAHVGQHSECCLEYANESQPATPEEYQELKAELEGIGYNLKVLRKYKFK